MSVQDCESTSIDEEIKSTLKKYFAKFGKVTADSDLEKLDKLLSS